MHRTKRPYAPLTAKEVELIVETLRRVRRPTQRSPEVWALALELGCSPRSVVRALKGESFGKTVRELRDGRMSRLARLDPVDTFLEPAMNETAEKPTAPKTDLAKDPTEPSKFFTLNETLTEATGPDGTKYKVTLTPGAPPIIRDPAKKINKGKPTSVFDLNWEKYHGKKLKGKHALPKDGKYAVRTIDLDTAELLSPSRLFDKAQEAKTRGRKPSVTLEQARGIKSAFYCGSASIQNISADADLGKLSETTVSKIVKGEAYWYA